MEYVSQLLVRAEPYFDIRDKAGNLYMQRWWLVKPTKESPWGVRLHCTHRSDFERDFHDHPWPSSSQIVRGHVIEQLPIDQKQPPERDGVDFLSRDLMPGDLVTRTASDRHRLIIPGEPVWSIFTMGPWERDWGFYSQALNRWVYWREYLNDWTTDTSSDLAEDARNRRDNKAYFESQP